MKKIISSGVASIFAVIGLSSFSKSKIYLTSYYWFNVINPVSVTVTRPSFSQISGDYLGYSTFSFIWNPPDCTGSGALCLVGYTLGAISGFSSSGTPTGLQTTFGIPAAYTTTGATTKFF